MIIMAKEKVNNQEEYNLYQLWSEKSRKAVQVDQPKVTKVQITGTPCNIQLCKWK